MGGGPAGLYFGILMKRADPSHQVVVYERNRLGDTFGFGVVFSDATLGKLQTADPETYQRITEAFAHWDDIDIHYRGQVVTSTGHGFSGLSRMTLLEILAARARELGVELHFEHEVTDFEALKQDADLVFAADGVNSRVREQYAQHFKPVVDMRPNRFIWLGTTFPFQAFTFYFKANDHGMFRVHAYRYEEGNSTFIVECTEDTWRAAGLDTATEADSVAYCEQLFAKELDGHRLIANRSIWRQFPNITCGAWSFENVVLVGDAVHTAHFSIGSGTKLAMEDAIDLAEALASTSSVQAGLQAYEAGRKAEVASLQRAAQVSLEWFEQTERYMNLAPLQFAFTLLTRSMRITHENLQVRDPALMDKVDRWFHEESQRALGEPPAVKVPPPMFNRFGLRELTLPNRVVVSPMCMYSAEDGTVNDFHLVHLGSRAMGGAGLVITEMTDVSADGRITPGCAGMYADHHVGAWRRITEFVHRYTEAKIGMQLAHAGRKGATYRPWEARPDAPLPADEAWPLIAASAIPYLPGSQAPRAMDDADMDRVVSDFVHAAEMADAAGFDMLELHCAHGYLLATFISPLTNQRTDAYGGSLENRMRFPLRVFSAVRAVWPADKPISVRISATDWHPDGLDGEDAVDVARLLYAAGADIIDVSTGQTDPGSKPRYGRLYQTPFSERIRLSLGRPTMTVGAITSYADVNSILAAGRADLAVLARAHLFDPYWTRHAAYEQDVPPAWPDQYKAISRFNFRFK
ncbi:MAG: bifunctional salicylyl-CoA 5-hydroxylase/oxidoreductase [Myxococcales bacterium]|nr:bifunctional salicylyl-CoA 5-hydroxylase/oxidoreductase [Myxococcales bacterium]